MIRLPLILFLLILVFPLYAQEKQLPENPKVGLVLSGGGAKGMAHIGALKIIEEAGVKIDFIGGTSMGAIIGALYASGYSAAELDSLVINTPLSSMIQDNLPRGAKTFYEKEDSERYALTLPFKNFKISFPSAISGGQHIYNELVRLLYHVKDVRDFNNLPIPFYCIGTNIETGKEVLLNKGYLPEAIMASGTFPSLFEPAEVDGEIIIDGGVLNNYPVYEMREMGADIIIGVDVQHGLRDRGSLDSATDILLQINNFRTVNVMAEKSLATDIYIKPDMQEFSVIDFALKKSIIAKGEEAAKTQLEALQQLAATQQASPQPRIPIQNNEKLTIDRLFITGDQNYSRGYVKGKLRFNLKEETTFKKLQQGFSNLAATGNFKTIRYRLINKDGGEDLIIDLKDNPNKFFLRAGVHYDDLYKSAALLNLTKKRFLFDDDVATFDLILGDNIRYNLQYYIDKGLYWSIGINSRFNDFDREINYDVISSNFPAPVSPNINSITLDVDDFTNQFYLQTVIKEEFAFRIGAEHKYLTYSTNTINEISASPNPGENPRIFFEKSNYYSTFGKLILDTYNNRYFPSRGLYFNGDLHVYLFSSDFNDNFKEFSIAKARMGAAFPIIPNLSVNIEAEGGFKLGTSNVSTFDFVLGGFGNNLINNFIPFFGYDHLSLPGNSFVKAYARFDLEIAPKSHIMFAGNMTNVEDDIFRTGEWFTGPDYTGFALGYGFESFMGPLQVYYSWNPELRDGLFFFSLGYWF